MEKSREAHDKAEEEGLSFREAERVMESELFLDKYPQWGLGTPHQLVILHEMFLHASVWEQKETEHTCHQGCQSSIQEPNSEADQSALQLIGYQTSRKEIRDVYHSIYLLNRLPGSPSCGEARRRRAIQDILSSLWNRLQRWTYSAEAEGLDAHGEEGESAPPQSYEAALWAAHQKALETTETLQSDLDRLDNKHRGGHRSIVTVEVDLGPSLEVNLGPSLEVNPGPSLEVDPGPILKVSLGIKQEPKVKAITALTPKMSGPTP